MSKQRYPEEFKTEAVKQITERGYKVADVSARLGVSQHSLYQWIKARQMAAAADALFAAAPPPTCEFGDDSNSDESRERPVHLVQDRTVRALPISGRPPLKNRVQIVNHPGEAAFLLMGSGEVDVRGFQQVIGPHQ